MDVIPLNCMWWKTEGVYYSVLKMPLYLMYTKLNEKLTGLGNGPVLCDRGKKNRQRRNL
jgi:hypothetical protein